MKKDIGIVTKKQNPATTPNIARDVESKLSNLLSFYPIMYGGNPSRIIAEASMRIPPHTLKNISI